MLDLRLPDEVGKVVARIRPSLMRAVITTTRPGEGRAGLLASVGRLTASRRAT